MATAKYMMTPDILVRVLSIVVYELRIFAHKSVIKIEQTLTLELLCLLLQLIYSNNLNREPLFVAYLTHHSFCWFLTRKITKKTPT